MFGFLKLPDRLRSVAYCSGEEAAWPNEQTLMVIDCLTELDVAVCGIEVWLPTEPGPTIPTPYIYTWTAEERRSGEVWSEFVRRANTNAKDYVRGFDWDPEDRVNLGLKPYFNLDAVRDPSHS